jgi:hypothetical protein
LRRQVVDPAVPGTETPDPTIGDPTPGEGDPTPGQGDGESEPKTFTQEQVNALMAKEVSKATRGKLDPKELGFESAKEAQEFLTKAKELTEQQKTEAEKELEARVKQARDEATAEVLGKAKQIALRAEFTVQATQAGVVDPEGAFILAQTQEDWKEIQVSDDGTVSGLDDAFFESLKEAKPYLFGMTPGQDGKPPAPRIDPGAGGASSDEAAQRAAELAKRYPALQQAGIRVQP